MIIYLEKKAKDFEITKNILKKYKNKNVLEIDNYKNIFYKTKFKNSEKSLILASSKGAEILKAPKNYGHSIHSYFFKTSINCMFDCDYCYLHGAFKNSSPVFFLNYEEIKINIEKKVLEVQKTDKKNTIWFYSSDYSDIQSFDFLTDFNKHFMNFFDKFENVMMETRTKSADISSILNLNSVPKNTEVAISLNPEILIKKYEKGTADLEKRIKNINLLLEKGFKVGIRFMPLLPEENYLEIYEKFLKEVYKKINMEKINSIFSGGLLFTKKDYGEIVKKKNLKIFYKLKEEKDGFFRADKKIRKDFYELFKKFDKNCRICMDELDLKENK